MTWFSRLSLVTLAFLFLLTPTNPALAEPSPTPSDTLNAYFFYGDGCPHCAKAEKFFEQKLLPEFPDLQIHHFEVYRNRKNSELLQQTATALGVQVGGVPFLVIGNEVIAGYAPGFSDQLIRDRVLECYRLTCPDDVAAIVGLEEPISPATTNPESETTAATATSSLFNLPGWGQVDALTFSLPLLTVVLGTLDGFNPCALWALFFLISLLLGMKNRRRMWLLGSTFIVASAFVYFMFMAAWLNLILFLGLVMWVRLLIGLLALGGGAYSLKEYFFSPPGVCKVSGGTKRQQFFERLKQAVQENSLWLALGGIILLAFAVNLVELICSAGLPAVYTQVLALNNLTSWQYYSYILLYILFFMLDDLFVFIVAMITLELTGVTGKYAHVARLIGGVVMVAIGLLLIFKPEWLMFG
ncbi:MAG: hypothetical protein A2589_03345 [Candidatus Vogelbacteria bacterium RIFOXYD1_FULL_46_19]|uniref:Thioredoxin domain-containing protein n=1 Tax=Candidatus Vogelbacteria bacterium RIFOXYD1_FULL_46_19 TaxID=1802439 RepID=A0A1G2QHJ1_9BACT|nr:MAG: hypothetical protein A2589_03345 [Candidatus Vogelbacteria bacterium RIFOXYD1_FULL_46_19]